MHPTLKLFLFSFIFFTACTKEYSFEKGKVEVYFVKCKVDGISKEYYFCEAGDHTDPLIGDLSVYGSADSATSANPGFFAFEIGNATKKITAGEYRDTATEYQLYAVYVDSVNTVQAYNAGVSTVASASAAGVTIDNHLQVIITELQTYTARGEFSGDFYLDGDATKRMIKITEGSFYVRMN